MRQYVWMVKYGYYYAGALLAGGALLTYLAGWPYGVPFYILAVFCLNFFRDPERHAPPGPVAVSPADGKVVAVVPGPGGASRVSIFLNIFDVHVNRSPIAGKIACINYKKGEFLVASKEAASQANEQNILSVEGLVGGRRTQVTFKQIAGLIARRIICYKRVGDIVEAGERVGLIKFGSRVDVLFGPEWEVTVRPGERVAAGSSVIARIVEELARTTEPSSAGTASNAEGTLE
jgi:phosphatidylserine decarboxylase